MNLNIQWSDLKEFATSRSISIQYIIANGQYYLFASDGPMQVTAQILMDGSQSDDQTDFETNFKPNANQPILPVLTSVTTQYEKNDKILKLAKGYAAVDSSNTATIYVKVPGTFGTGEGRYVIGGYAISSDYNADDFCTCYVEDKDRIIALMIAQAGNPSATIPVDDSVVQGMGVIPGIGQAFPNYPVVQSYTDDEQSADSQGWYFWPLSQGHDEAPVGEIEINPIGGYGFMPAGFYLKIVYNRPSDIVTGALRVNIDWGKKD